MDYEIGREAAMSGKKRAENKEEKGDGGKKSRGRPSKFKKTLLDQVTKLARLGCTEKEIADVLGISIETLNLWKRERPEFLHSLKLGKLEADAEIADSMYHRARGYSHRAVKIFGDPKTGAVKVVPYTEHYPPDTPAGKFWLTNRQRDKWKERIDVKHEAGGDLAARLAAATKRVKSGKGGGGKG